jgi:hypothetical protein
MVAEPAGGGNGGIPALDWVCNSCIEGGHRTPLSSRFVLYRDNGFSDAGRIFALN